jgi:O-acetyl-ADP-ribose deacetylase (regulator of RNase III)
VTMFQWMALASAALTVTLGLVLLLGGRRHPGTPRNRTRAVAAWLVLAMCPVLVIFLFFPDSSVTGDFGWGQATGAIGAFIVIWGVGIRSALTADRIEAQEAQSLRAASAAGDEFLSGGDVLLYRLATKPRRAVGLVPGGLAHLRFADAWVNSENTNMQMARFYDQSISGVIRYLGACHDDAGEVVEDVVAAELAERMGNRRQVSVGTVFETGPGGLAESNQVERLFHVAAVSGQFGRGYTVAEDVAMCVRNVLKCAEKTAATSEVLRSILLPVLGSGTGRGDREKTTRAVLGAVLDHLEEYPNARISTIYVIVSTAGQLATCRSVLDGDPRLEPARPTPRARLHPSTAR